MDYEWWIGKDLEGSGRRLLDVLSASMPGLTSRWPGRDSKPCIFRIQVSVSASQIFLLQYIMMAYEWRWSKTPRKIELVIKLQFTKNVLCGLLNNAVSVWMETVCSRRHWYPSARMYGIITQQTITWTYTAVETFSDTSYSERIWQLSENRSVVEERETRSCLQLGLHRFALAAVSITSWAVLIL
jgi:hypothetical protein